MVGSDPRCRVVPTRIATYHVDSVVREIVIGMVMGGEVVEDSPVEQLRWGMTVKLMKVEMLGFFQKFSLVSK